MNILFVTNKNVYPLIGGIERVTYALASAFTRLYNWDCYSIYTQENALQRTTDNVFAGKYLWQCNEIDQLKNTLDNWKIEAVVAQGADARVNTIMPQIREAINLSQQRPKLIFVFHNLPGYELVKEDIMSLLFKIIHGINLSVTLHQLVVQVSYKFFPERVKRRLVNKYATPYYAADKVMLLSESYKSLYDEFVKSGEEKYIALPNVFSFEDVIKTPKEKEILVVARLEERHKRIKAALSAWKLAYKEDWQLRIVGSGQDMPYYLYLVKKWKLRNVTFEGQQNPLRYYQSASIFLMTSALEGWPMTLMEAQQCGCVPIAFDSFGAVHDMIQSGRNGYIVPNNDVEAYARVLQELMNNDTLRAQMAANAQKDVQRFSRENIAKQWKTLLENL